MDNRDGDQQHKDASGEGGTGGQPAGGEKPSLRKRIEDWLYPAAAVYTLGDAPEKVAVVLQKVIEGLGTYFGFATNGITSADEIPWLLGELGQVPELVVDLRDELLDVADALPGGGKEQDELVEAILATCFRDGRDRVRIRNDMARAAVKQWYQQRGIPGADPASPNRPR